MALNDIYIPKQLIYYFYLDSYECYEIYKIHLECIKQYGDIFFKYTFILSVDDENNNDSFINYWEDIISNYIGQNKNIEFIVVKNNSTYREGIHYYNLIYKKLNTYDGLVCFGHGKRDFNFEKTKVYDWIISSHFIMSYDITEIENKLIYDKYLFSGPNLGYFNGVLNNIMYWGSFYWMNPKKIYNMYYDQINKFIEYTDFYFNDIAPYYFEDITKDNRTNYDNIIYCLAEINNLINSDIKYLHSFQKRHIIFGSFKYEKNDDYIIDINCFLVDTNMCKLIDEDYYFDFITKEKYLDYYNKITLNTNIGKEENTN